MWYIAQIDGVHSKELIITDEQGQSLSLTAEEWFDDSRFGYITVFDVLTHEKDIGPSSDECEQFDRLYTLLMKRTSSKTFERSWALAAVSENGTELFGKYSGVIGLHRMRLRDFIDLHPESWMECDQFSLHTRQIESIADLKLALSGF